MNQPVFEIVIIDITIKNSSNKRTYDRIAEFVLWHAFTVGALKRVLRTSAFSCRLAVGLVLAGRAVGDAIASAGARHASTRNLASERFRGTPGAAALFVGTVAAIASAIAHEEPADARAAAPTLKYQETFCHLSRGGLEVNKTVLARLTYTIIIVKVPIHSVLPKFSMSYLPYFVFWRFETYLNLK